ncbi:MAG: hypothetical protein ACI8R4_001966 [Paracoccaceae bacterium]|jgi:hypothetical protein
MVSPEQGRPTAQSTRHSPAREPENFKFSDPISLKEIGYWGGVVLLALTMGAGLAREGAAQDNLVVRALELPSHRVLMTRIARPGTLLAEFETDGCSGGLSDAWRLVASQFPDFAATYNDIPPWESCCVIHDRAYHNAGGAQTPEASYGARLLADKALEQCVVQTGIANRDEMAQTYGATPDQVVSAYGVIAGAMYLAVRFGGAPCSGLPWRWGFGFADCSILATSRETEVLAPPARD